MLVTEDCFGHISVYSKSTEWVTKHLTSRCVVLSHRAVYNCAQPVQHVKEGHLVSKIPPATLRGIHCFTDFVF
jgi:hypothetical protein